MNIAEIRRLSNATVIEQKCKAALLRSTSQGERAELLYLCAKAISQSRERQADALQYAERAATAAAEADMFVLSVDIACLRLSCLAANRPAEDVQAAIDSLRSKVTDAWIKRAGAYTELHQVYARLDRLQASIRNRSTTQTLVNV